MKNAKRRTKTKAAGADKKGSQERPAASSSAQPAEGLQTRHFVLGAFAALAALFAVYWRALNGPFLFDDQYLPFQDPNLVDAPFSKWVFGVRPTLMLTYWINYQISATQTASHHFFNVIFHFGAGVFLFLVVRKLLGLAGTDGWRQNLIAAFSGAVFLFHPIQSESVAYIAGRSENLSVLFFFAAFAAFLYRKSDAIGFPRAFLVLALFGLAVTSKEHTAMLPFLLLLTDYFWNPGFSFEGVKRNWRLYLPILAAGAAGFGFVFYTLTKSITAGFGVEGLSWQSYFATQCKAIWIYVRMFFLPFGQNADHNYLFAEFSDPFVIAGILALVGAAAAAWVFRRKFSLAVYGFFAFLLLLAPTSSFIPIKDALVERRLYLPMIGLLLIVAELLRRWKTTPKTLGIAAAVVVLVFATMTAGRAAVWSNPILLWEDSVAQNPNNWRASFQLAYAYYAEQRCSESAEQYARTAELSEADYRLLLDWALAEDCAGRPESAVEKLEQAAKLERTPHVFTQIALIHGRRGKLEEALAALDEADKTNRYFALTHFYRGNVYTQMGKWREAVESYKLALAIDKNMEAARRGLAQASARLKQSK